MSRSTFVLAFIAVISVVRQGFCDEDSSGSGSETDGPPGTKFLAAAATYVNNRDGILDLYLDHVAARSQEGESQLDDIFEDMIDYIKHEQLSQSSSPLKHIVDILTDDQGYGDVGYQDSSFVTPAMEALVSSGVRFDSFYSQSSCSPTRASLLTGLTVTKTGLQDGAILTAENRSLPLGIKTAGEYFRDAGYSTYFVGKWHVGHRTVSLAPYSRGYDYFFGSFGGSTDSYTKNIGLQCGSAQDRFVGIFQKNCSLPVVGYTLNENGTPYVDVVTPIETLLITKAINRIDLHDKTKPMLLHYHTTNPHTPMVVESKYYSLCSGVTPSTGAYQTTFRQIICGMVASVDVSVLQLLFSLGLNGMLPSTLITFSSDNGGLIEAGSTNLAFRSGKGTLFEGGIRTLGFMFGNGLMKSGIRSVRNDLVDVSDVLPTMLGYAGITVPNAPFDGINHWNILSKPGNRQLTRTNIPIVAGGVAVANYAGFLEVINGRRYKYLFNPSVQRVIAQLDRPPYVPEGEFLFDITSDPTEANNLISDPAFANIVATLKSRIVDMRASAVLQVALQFNHPPSPGGCYIPMNSPLWTTASCPRRPGMSGGLWSYPAGSFSG